MADDIASKVKKIIMEELGVDPEKVTDAASFVDDLGADSLDSVELVMAFEGVSYTHLTLPTTPYV